MSRISIYKAKHDIANGNGWGNGVDDKPIQVSGRALAHTHRTPSQRAAVAAQLVKGEVVRTEPTIIQASQDLNVSVPYTQLALKLTPATRARVAAGEITILEAARANGLLAAWLAATPEEKVALGIAVGVDEVWDAAIKPSLG